MGMRQSAISDPSAGSPSGWCRIPESDKVEKGFQAFPDQLRQIVGEIHRRAPGAHILFVDYATVFPDTGDVRPPPIDELAGGQWKKYRQPAPLDYRAGRP